MTLDEIIAPLVDKLADTMDRDNAQQFVLRTIDEVFRSGIARGDVIERLVGETIMINAGSITHE